MGTLALQCLHVRRIGNKVEDILANEGVEKFTLEEIWGLKWAS